MEELKSVYRMIETVCPKSGKKVYSVLALYLDGDAEYTAKFVYDIARNGRVAGEVISELEKYIPPESELCEFISERI